RAAVEEGIVAGGGTAFVSVIPAIGTLIESLEGEVKLGAQIVKEEYNKFWDDIQIFIKYGCLKDESFYEKVKECILFKTIDDEYI
ncbi:hypothetical protein ACTPEM_23050, partial [Clostridioides difficile]